MDFKTWGKRFLEAINTCARKMKKATFRIHAIHLEKKKIQNYSRWERQKCSDVEQVWKARVGKNCTKFSLHQNSNLPWNLKPPSTVSNCISKSCCPKEIGKKTYPLWASGKIVLITLCTFKHIPERGGKKRKKKTVFFGENSREKKKRKLED